MKSALKKTTLALCLLSGPALWGWLVLQDLTYLMWLVAISVLPWSLLLLCWYVVFGEAKLKQRAIRSGAGLLGVILIGFVAKSVLRYDGSSSGSSFPKYSFIWQDAPSHLDTGPVEVEVNRDLPSADLEQAPGNLNQFFGPNRDATWSAPTFGNDWTSTPPQLVWRRPIGMGWSSFVVSGNKALTQEQAGPDESVTCIDLFTGETLWQHRDAGIRLLEDHPKGGGTMGGDGPRSTPTIHGNRVYTLGSTGIVNCLDLETGDLIWKRDVIVDFDGAIQVWGMANSPLVLAKHGTVLIPGSDKPGATLVAFNLEDGETVWTYQGQGASYSSPRAMEFFGVPMIVCVNMHDATGHDPATGKALWTFPWQGNFPRAGQPIQVGEDRLLMTASYGMGSPLIRLEKSGDQWSVEQEWSSSRLKTKFSSAVVLGNYAYGLDEGRLACIDLAKGKKAWKKQKFGFGQHLLFGNHLLVQTEDGPIVYGEISPEGFKETGRIDDALDSMTWNVPAVAGRLLLVRNDKEAACYLLPAPTPGLDG